MNHKVDIYDTTLRDGTQAENFNLSVEDRVRISLKLDELGIDFIEGGWPGSNPSAVEFFKIMQGQTLKHAKLTAFGSTRNFNKPADKLYSQLEVRYQKVVSTNLIRLGI